MSPVFAHGQLRLYLLALLADGPRHGYEVIQELEKRFGGLYSPSAGTIYPRLAKLEEEGLVQRTDEGRKATYRITDAGRAEVAARVGELEDLRADLDQSVRRIAEQVRAQVHGRSADLRAELQAAARAARAAARPGRPGMPPTPLEPTWVGPAGESPRPGAEEQTRHGSSRGGSPGWGAPFLGFDWFGWAGPEIDRALHELGHQARTGWRRHGLTPAQSAEIAEIISDATSRIAQVLRQPTDASTDPGAGKGAPADAAPADATPPDTAPADTAPADATPPDAAPADATPPDAAPVDAVEHPSPDDTPDDQTED